MERSADIERIGKKMKKNRIAALIIAAMTAVSMTACGNTASDSTSEATAQISAAEETPAEESSAEDTSAEDTSAETSEETSDAAKDGVKVVNDREGGTIEIKGEINTIVSGAPSVTEILVGLGLGDKIIAADAYSADVEGIDPSICTLDFYNLDIEAIAAMNPDAVIINGISMTGADDPYSALKDAGVQVLYVPSSESVQGVMDDIEFLAECTGTEEKAFEITMGMSDAIAEVVDLSQNITEKKKVYFEVSAAPYMYTCGSGTFADDILNIIGAENIYSSESGWINNTDESVIAADPDVIITSVKYDGYDYNEIYSREGWENISAIKNHQVYQVEPNPVSRPSQNVVEGIRIMAQIVYPDIYSDLSGADLESDIVEAGSEETAEAEAETELDAAA